MQAGTNKRFSYDQGGRLTSQTSSDGETHKYSYNSKGELSSSSYATPESGTVKTVFTYGNYNDSGERLLKKLNIHSSRFVIDYDYDSFYRAGNTITLSSGASLATTYTFRSGTGTNATSVMPKSQTQVMKDQNGTTTDTLTTNYTYDSLGNIVTVKEGTVQKLKYYYDDLNQLTREDNKYLNKTITYSYDRGGNLNAVKEYAYQTGEELSGTGTTVGSYVYGDSNWKDKLTSYNGHTISYDAIGNPLQYHNGYTFTWKRGRQLATANNGTNSISYTYNSDGIRTAKTVNGTTTNYVLEGTKVVFETDGNDGLWFYYNAAGAPVGFRMNTGSSYTLFVYRKNLQGDITGIYKGYTGELMVSYSYDAWGKVTATNEAGNSTGTTLINRNPYLYRGYRYDRETGLYYLNSRYYDPETGRFINADGLVSTGQGVLGNNMFAYCLNNPVCMLDESGESAILSLRTLYLPDYSHDPYKNYDTVILHQYVNEDRANRSKEAQQKSSVLSNTGENNATEGNDIPISLSIAPFFWDFGRIKIGTSSPEKVKNPNGWYIKVGNNWEVYAAAYYSESGKQIYRIDFQGKAHAGVEPPHIHTYEYPSRGGRISHFYDIYGNKIY